MQATVKNSRNHGSCTCKQCGACNQFFVEAIALAILFSIEIEAQIRELKTRTPFKLSETLPILCLIPGRNEVNQLDSGRCGDLLNLAELRRVAVRIGHRRADCCREHYTFRQTSGYQDVA